MVQIVTDSAADFEPDELKSMGIICIPLTVMFGNTAYKENKNLTKNAFYKLLKVENHFPTTSQPSPSDFYDVFHRLKLNGDDTVAVFISSKLSGTYQGALCARNISEYENCFIVDSLNAAAGERILVEYAVHLRNEGKTAIEIVQALEKLKHRIKLYACMDTLEYLYKGGRISGVTAAVGSIIHIKPIICLSSDGKVEVPLRVVGIQRGFRYILDRLKVEKPDLQFPMYVMYTHIRDKGFMLADELKKAGYDISEKQVKNVGAAIGAHIGPDACGLVYVTV